MEPYVVIIADSLTNDFMSPDPRFAQVAVNLGGGEISRLLKSCTPEEPLGVLPTFLELAAAARRSGRRVGTILVRDLHDPEDPEQQPELLRYGPHNLRGSPGAEFIPEIAHLVGQCELVETTTLALPLAGWREAMRRLLGVDPLELDPGQRGEVRFILAGCHTDKRILGTAHLLRNVLEFPDVLVAPHLVGSNNREAHYATLQGTLPDALVRVVTDLGDLAVHAGLDPAPLARLPCHGCRIGPAGVVSDLHPDRRAILEVALLRWSAAELVPLSGGFSGSGLFLAQGDQEGAAVTPVVIKMDTHPQMRRELDGYYRVKERMGPAVPLFAPPISCGSTTGVVMELATREGNPITFQARFAKARGETELDSFLNRLERAITTLSERLYRHTLQSRRFNPCKELGLANPRQVEWLGENLDHIQGDSTWRGGLIRLEGAGEVPDFTAQFQTLSAASAESTGQTALVHGDLNLANLIADQLDNLWIIDWTHTGHHPVELDFAKLENDIKFVVSKEFFSANLPQLRKLEELFLETPIPPPWNELPEELAELSYDLRIQKIYRSVRTIRLGLRALVGKTNWLHYRLALLRYAIHTLSFDLRRNRGECKLPQLQYAVISSALLVQGLTTATAATDQ